MTNCFVEQSAYLFQLNSIFSPVYLDRPPDGARLVRLVRLVRLNRKISLLLPTAAWGDAYCTTTTRKPKLSFFTIVSNP